MPTAIIVTTSAIATLPAGAASVAVVHSLAVTVEPILPGFQVSHFVSCVLSAAQDALLFGDEDLRVRPLLKVSPRHFNLFMDDGCVPHADRIM